MEPLNYAGTFANIPSPQASFMEGVKNGAGLQQLQQQQAAAAAARAQQQQMQNDLAELSQNPTTDAIGRMSLKYPQLSENFKRSFDIMEPAQKQAKLEHASQVYAAINNNQPDVAVKILSDQAAALRNAGNEKDAKAAEMMATMVKDHPQMAKTSAGLILSAAVGPDKFAATYGAVGGEQRAQEQAPADLSKKRAEAVKAGAEATVAAGTIPALIQKPVEENLSAQTKREVDKFNAQIAAANSETDRGRLVLERDKFISEQGKKTLETGAGAQDAMDSANALMDQIRGVSGHPGLDAGTGTLGGIRSFFNSTDANDFRKAVEGLKAPVFLNELGKLKAAGITLGAVTEAEGKKLEQRIANLDTDQSTPAFKNQVGVLLKDTEKFIEKIKASGKLPTKGGAFVMDHPKLGKITEGDINRMISKNPGATREQVMAYLQSVQTGGASGDY